MKTTSMSYSVCLGVAYACVTAVLALDVAAGGHGWNSSIISASGLLLIPLAAATYFARDWGSTKMMMTAVLMLTIVADLCLIVFTVREGLQYVVRSINAAPFLVLCWAGLWTGWQIAFVAGMVVKRGRKETSSP